MEGVPVSGLTVQVLAPSILTAMIGGVGKVELSVPTAMQTALVPVPTHLVALKKPMGVMPPETGLTDHVLAPSMLDANNGGLTPVLSRPAAVQTAAAPLPEQLTDVKEPFAGKLVTDLDAQVVAPFILTASVGTLEESAPTTVQMVVDPVPVQLTLLKLPPAAIPETGFSANVLAPSVLTAKRVPALVRSCPAATQIAVNPLPTQLTELYKPLVGVRGIVCIVHVAPLSLLEIRKGSNVELSRPAATQIAVVPLPVQLTPLK